MTAQVWTLEPSQPGSDPHTKTQAVKRKMENLLGEHRLRLLDLATVGRLLPSGDVAEVLPLDNAEALSAANPIKPDGRFVIDEKAIDRRRDAIVRTVLNQDSGLIVVGGGHDLPEAVKRSGRAVQYLRVTTKRVKQFAP